MSPSGSSSSSSSSSSPPPLKRIKLSPLPCRKSRTRSSWTEADELRLLNVVLQIMTTSDADASPPGERRSLFDRIFGSLHRDYTKEQVLDKLKGLKQRFRNRSTSAAAETSHTRALFEICEKIWGGDNSDPKR